MPRKKQAAKGKSKLPGIHISSLLGSNSDKPKKVDPADDKPSDNTLIENVVNCPTKLLDYEEAVICRTVVELALANILLGGSNNQPQANMAPPPPPSSDSSSSGFSKFQDFGRSLLGFLIGGSPQDQGTVTQTRRQPGQGIYQYRYLFFVTIIDD